MRGLILLDGPDCAGKTTLANCIEAEVKRQGMKAVVRHLGKPEPGTCWRTHRAALLDYIKYMLHNDCVVIADRHFLSEMVYGDIYRDGSEYPHLAIYMDMLFDRYRALKVICCPPPEKVIETHAEMKKLRHEDYQDRMGLVAHRFLQIWSGINRREDGTPSLPLFEQTTGYLKELIQRGGVRDRQLWYHFDYTDNSALVFAYHLLAELESEQDYYGDDADEMNFTGTASKLSTLLVTSQRYIARDTLIPFFDDHESSEILAKGLCETPMVSANRLCIAAIDDPNGPETVSYLADRCKQVIAVGKVAERQLEDLDIAYHDSIKDPANFKRDHGYVHAYNYYFELTTAIKP